MTNSYVDEEMLKKAAQSIIEDYKEAGKTFTPEEEVQFSTFVAGLVYAEPPTDEQVWETIETLRAALAAKDKANALRAITLFMLQFISGCEHSPEAFQLLPMLNQVKEAIRIERFQEAGELTMAFLRKSREIARSM